MRIVSLVPHATEILDELGLSGDVTELDPAAIDQGAFRAALPELVFAPDGSLEEIRALARALPDAPDVVALGPRTFGETLADAKLIAERTQTGAAAIALVKDLRDRVDAVRRTLRDAGREPVAAAAIEWFDPLEVAGLWTPQMIEYAGGLDVLGLTGEPRAEVDWPVLAASAPEAIVVMPRGYDLQTAWREAEMHAGDLRATGARRIVAVDGSAYFSRPGLGLVDGLELLAHVLHPDLFPDASADALEL